MNDIKTNADHPIWDVYDEFRTARLNVRYYEMQVSSLRRRNLLIELVLGLSVSSGVAGLWLWETAVGGIIWKILVSVAAFLVVIKPLVRFSDQVQKKSNILMSWRLLDDGLRQFTISLKESGKYDNGIRNRFHALMENKSTIVKNEPTERMDEKLRTKCFHQVNQELPVDIFFIPEEVQ